MKTKVIPIRTGTAQAFLLMQDGKFGLVDSGNRNTEKRILKAINSRGLKIKDLHFIFLTHTHFDHAGNAAKADELFENRFKLQAFGSDAQIIHTPGHTSGSSILIADRKAFVGDTLFNIMGIKYPLFANDEAQLLKSWQQLLNMDVDFYYPAHGKRIKKAELMKAIKKQESM